MLWGSRRQWKAGCACDASLRRFNSQGAGTRACWKHPSLCNCFSAPILGHFPLQNLEPEQATAGPAAGPQLHLRVRWPYSRYARGCGCVEGAVKVVLWAGSAARRHRSVLEPWGSHIRLQGRKQGIKHCCVCQCYRLRRTECRVSGKGFWTGSAGIHPGLPCWRISHWHTVRWSWAVWHATYHSSYKQEGVNLGPHALKPPAMYEPCLPLLAACSSKRRWSCR